jgi:hypothetical protein
VLRTLFAYCGAGLFPIIAVGLLLPSFPDTSAILSLVMRVVLLAPIVLATIFFFGFSTMDRQSIWRTAVQSTARVAKG